jgi:hypothetical protein
MALNIAKQRHPTVPSSNNPPIPEWAPHYWYILRCAALQAHPDNDDNTATHIVNFFSSMTVVTPCPECREHFIEDWLAEPFTLAHAKHTEAAMRWVEDLRLKVEARVKAKLGTVPPVMVQVAAGAEAASAATAAAAAASAAAATAGTVSARSALPPARNGATAGSGVSTLRSRMLNQQRQQRAAVTTDASNAGILPETGHVAAQRKYAIRASLHVTAANRAGRRMGCNCAPKSATAVARRHKF